MFHDPSFWFFVSFALFFALLGKKLWIALRTQLDEYRNGIIKDFKESKRLRAKTSHLLEEIQQKHLEAEHLAKDLLQHAKKEVKLLREQALSDMESFLQNEEKTMAERIKIAEAQVIQDLREHALSRALDTAKERLAETLTPENDRQWIEKALTAVEGNQMLDVRIQPSASSAQRSVKSTQNIGRP